MSSKIKTIIQDLSYREYQERQYLHIDPQQIAKDAQHIEPTSRFSYNGQVWEPSPYKGYAVLSMVKGHGENQDLYTSLSEIQAKLEKRLDSKGTFYMLPPESFHQTVANTLSADRYKKQIVDQDLTVRYPTMIMDAMDLIPVPEETIPIKMRLIGMSIFRTALGILGTFDREVDYQRILDFRNKIYHYPPLNAVDVKRTRPFIGHITFAYIGKSLNEEQKNGLITYLRELNEEISKKELIFEMSVTELRTYENLSSFAFEPHFPFFHFVKLSGK